jgi:hypothetical protein
MTASEKEVAFRKRRREYAVNKPKNAIRASTTVIRIKEPRFYRAETILANARAVKADKRKFDINSTRRASVNFPQPPDELHVALVIPVLCRFSLVSSHCNKHTIGVCCSPGALPPDGEIKGANGPAGCGVADRLSLPVPNVLIVDRTLSYKPCFGQPPA